ncbi:hypothetical protein D3C78_1270730 [compost metagenome]
MPRCRGQCPDGTGQQGRPYLPGHEYPLWHLQRTGQRFGLSTGPGDQLQHTRNEVQRRRHTAEGGVPGATGHLKQWQPLRRRQRDTGLQRLARKYCCLCGRQRQRLSERRGLRAPNAENRDWQLHRERRGIQLDSRPGLWLLFRGAATRCRREGLGDLRTVRTRV